MKQDDPVKDVRWVSDAALSPAVPGTYLLAVWLPWGAPLPPRLRARHESGDSLAPGWLLYAGSARGPGGLRARLGRHLRPEKTRRWHIDWLTTAPGACLWAYPFEGRGPSECTLIEHVLQWPGAFAPISGFGSSDCTRCRSHLVALPDAQPKGSSASPLGDAQLPFPADGRWV